MIKTKMYFSFYLFHCILIIAFVNNFSHAQIIDTLFTKQYFKENYQFGIEILENNDNSFLYLYSSRDTSSHNIAVIAKIDTNNMIAWEKSILGPNIDVSLNDVSYTRDGHFVVSGQKGDFGVLAKIDVSANVIWEKQYGMDGISECRKAKQTSDNGFLLVGTYRKSMDSTVDCWIVKTDENGVVEWEKTFGDTAYDAFDDFVEIPDNHGYLCVGCIGTFYEYTNGFVAQYNRDGNFEDSTITELDGGCNAICMTTDTTYLVVGGTKSGNQMDHAWYYGFFDLKGNKILKKESQECGYQWLLTLCKASNNTYLIGGRAAYENLGSFHSIYHINSQGDSLGESLYKSSNYAFLNINSISNNRYVATSSESEQATGTDLRYTLLKFNYPPYFITTTNGMCDTIYDYTEYIDTVIAKDSFPNDIPVYQIISGPPLKIDSSTGIITWNPEIMDTGFHTLSFLAKDRIGQTDTLSYTLMVLPNLNPIVKKKPKEDSLYINIQNSITFSITPNPHFFNIDSVTFFWKKDNLQVGNNSSYWLWPDSSMLLHPTDISCKITDSTIQDSVSWVVFTTITGNKVNMISRVKGVTIKLFKKKIILYKPNLQNKINSGQIIIYTLLGKEIFRQKINSLEGKLNVININHLTVSNGLYIIDLQLDNCRTMLKVFF